MFDDEEREARVAQQKADDEDERRARAAMLTDIMIRLATSAEKMTVSVDKLTARMDGDIDWAAKPITALLLLLVAIGSLTVAGVTLAREPAPHRVREVREAACIVDAHESDR